MELITLLSRNQTVDCRWVCVVKFLPDNKVKHMKGRLVSKGYTHTYGIDYVKTLQLQSYTLLNLFDQL